MASPLRVLILEGEPTDAELMLDALRQAAFAPHWRRVDTKEDYLAGLVPAPDVILADYHLPEFDARWALGRLRERGLDIPFIIVTGSLNEEAAVECMTQGAADYLLKDRLSRLGPAVARVLHEKRLRDEQRRAEAERFLAKASALLAGSLDFEGTLQSLALLAVPFLADRCVVELAGGDETIRLVRSAHADSTKEERARELYHRLRQRPETDPVSAVLRTRQSLLLAEVTDESLRRIAPDDEWLAAAREFGVRSAIFVPLLAGGRTLGAVSFAMVESGRRYGSADLALVEELTRRVALAVDHARLYREAQRTADQLRLLIEVGRAAGQSLELHQVLQQIVDTLGERLNVDRCFIRLLEPGGFLPVRAIHAPDPELRERTLGSVVRLEDSLSGIVIRKRGVVSLEDARQNTFLSPAIGARLAPATWIHHAPILGRDGPIGSLIVSARSERRPFRADDAALVEAVARQAAIAIDNARLYEEARRRSERLAALVEVARAISATLDPDSIYAIAFEQLQRLVPGDRYAIAVYDPERHGFRLVAVRCAPGLADPWPVGTFVPEDEALGALACRHGHTIIIPDARQDPMPLVRQAAESGIGSAAVTPILADGAWLGSLSVLSRQVDGFDESHLPVLDAFAAQIAVALQNAATHARLAVSLTEVKATQEHLVQIERLRAVGELASGVAHDFNNMLAAVLGQAEVLLLSADLPADVRRGLEVIQRAALDGAETVRRLQELGRPRSDQARVAANLSRIGQEVLEITRSRWRDDAQRRGTPIEVVAELGTVPPIAGRPAELREALTNLVINAIQAMPAGGRLTLRTSVDLAQGEVSLEVRDSGVGMTEDARKRMFEPFFTTKGVGGTGLGLSVVYGIVTRHQGRIQVESEPGRGTALLLTFPILREAPAEVGPVAIARRQRRGRLLVVEDNPTVLQNLTQILRLAGHEVVAATDGAAGLAAFSGDCFDAVLTDLGMPALNGLEMAEAIRRLGAQVPILLVTGWGHQLDHAQLAQRGISDVIVKPFRAVEVEDAVQRALAGSYPPFPRPPHQARPHQDRSTRKRRARGLGQPAPRASW